MSLDTGNIITLGAFLLNAASVFVVLSLKLEVQKLRAYIAEHYVSKSDMARFIRKGE